MIFICSALHHVDLCLGRARGWSCVTTFRPFHPRRRSRASIRAFFSIITSWIRMTGENNFFVLSSNVSSDSQKNEKSFRIRSIERAAPYNRINIDEISKAIQLQSSERNEKSELMRRARVAQKLIKKFDSIKSSPADFRSEKKRKRKACKS